MSTAANCRLLGRWLFVEADLWDCAYLDPCGSATLTIAAQGGEIASGAMEASLDVAYEPCGQLRKLLQADGLPPLRRNDWPSSAKRALVWCRHRLVVDMAAPSPR
jgi:hypothetical protein